MESKDSDMLRRKDSVAPGDKEVHVYGESEDNLSKRTDCYRKYGVSRCLKMKGVKEGPHASVCVLGCCLRRGA